MLGSTVWFLDFEVGVGGEATEESHSEEFGFVGFGFYPSRHPTDRRCVCGPASRVLWHVAGALGCRETYHFASSVTRSLGTCGCGIVALSSENWRRQRNP